ncbi:MAG: hypothetical protein ABW199_12975 [Caulobacterales bacterium]
MTRRGFYIRLAISIAIDLLDFSFGRVPVFGSVTEGVGSLVLVALWGPAGLLYLGELVDVTDQIDSFLPSATLIALLVGWRKGMIFQKKQEAAVPETRT